MGEGQFLAVQNIAQQLDVLIDAQQRLGAVIENISIEEQPNVMQHQDDIIQNCVLLGRKIDPTLALALAIQKKIWGDLDDVSKLFEISPWCSSSELDYSFEQYASRRTGRDPITIYNWTRTAELWLLDRIGPTEKVALIDPMTGLKMLEQRDNETVPIAIEWNPFEIDFTKLLLCNRSAKENQIDDVGYGLLANPESRWVDIRDYIHGILPWSRQLHQEHHELSFFIQGGLLYARKGAMSAIIGSLELDSEDFLVREAIARLVRTHNISIVV